MNSALQRDNKPGQKNPSAEQIIETNQMDLGLSESTVAFMAKNSDGVKHGPHVRPRGFTSVYGLRIKREATSRKGHIHKISKTCDENLGGCWKTIQWALKRFVFSHNNDESTIKLKENKKAIVLNYALTVFDEGSTRKSCFY